MASHLGIPLETVDFSRAYWSGVFEAWVEGYRRGATPNPDAACNRVIKFGAFRTHALGALGGDAFATGHYAQVWPDLSSSSSSSSSPGSAAALLQHQPRLYSAVDPRKDQSDFLATVPAGALHRAMFPLGALTKPSVRALAAAIGLPSAARRDSMGICFVGKRHLGTFLAQYLTPTPAAARCLLTGRSLTAAPLPIACAEALTCGQRLGLGGLLEPYYCVSNGLQGRGGGGRGSASTTVWAVPGVNHPALFSTVAAVGLEDFHWVSGSPPEALRQAALEATERGGGAASLAWAGTCLLPWLAQQRQQPGVTDMPVLFRERHSVLVEVDSSTGSEAVVAAPGVMTIVRASEFYAACAGLQQQQQPQRQSMTPEFLPLWKRLAQQQQQGSSAVDPLLLLLCPAVPVRAATPGQVLVLYSAQQTLLAEGAAPGSSEQLAEAQPALPLPGTSMHGGRLVFGGGGILCTGPSLMDMQGSAATGAH